MRIAFCTTCRGRAEHIKLTLPQNLADNADYRDAVFVLLNYNSPDDLLEYIQANHAKDIASGRLVVYTFPDVDRFHMAHAKNMAARCGMLEGADILVTLDADNYTGSGFASFVAEKFHEPGIVPGIFLCPDFAFIRALPHGPDRPARGFYGRLAVWSQTFVKVGGYDEIYDTWRGEDIDMNWRLQRAGYVIRHIDKQYLSTIPHGAEMRFREYPHAQQYETKHEEEMIKLRTETIVNYGRFGLGKVIRNGEKEVSLDPLPTRIFGIGMHKTATTSLHEALKILRFDSFHWGKGEAPLIWQEMNALGFSKMLEQWYALCDLPIPLLYRELDKAYPGSKFILTIRDDVDWLQSVKRLWDAKHNPTRWVWDVYPFTNHIHTVLYGQKDFDALIFLRRYRQHNAEVLEYFKDRPEDLLVLDMDNNDTWAKLCPFLNCPIPAKAYPRKNHSLRAAPAYS